MLRAQADGDLMVRLQDGEELFDSLRKLEIGSGVILNGIGMLREVTIAYWSGSEYQETEIGEPVELLCLQGNFTEGERPQIHCHAVLMKEDGTIIGGHLRSATVHNTNEIFIKELEDIKLRRKKEPSGLWGLYPTSH